MNGPNVPRLETERLILRGHRLDDFPAIRDIWADPIVTKYISGKPRPEEEAWLKFLRATGFWVHLGYGYWIVEDKETGAVMGETGFGDFRRDMTPSNRGEPEIGWSLGSSFHGRGLGFEAASAALAWGDEQNFKTPISCIIDTRNTPSVRIAEKLGFTETTRTTYHGSEIVLMHRG